MDSGKGHKLSKIIRKRHKLSKIWAVTNDKNYQEVSKQVTSIQIICRGQSVVHGVPATKRIIRSSSRQSPASSHHHFHHTISLSATLIIILIIQLHSQQHLSPLIIILNITLITLNNFGANLEPFPHQSPLHLFQYDGGIYLYRPLYFHCITLTKFEVFIFCFM